MARNRQMHERLENWGAWRVRQAAGPGRFASVNMMEIGGDRSDAFTEPPLTPNDEDARRVDGEVIKLPSEIRATVECYYVNMLNRTEAERLARLCISKRTLHERLERADSMLLAGLAQRAHAERVRAEQEAQRHRLAREAAQPGN